jgi:uncharacterized membrane protein YphA (DoxX/SURF4 family)
LEKKNSMISLFKTDDAWSNLVLRLTLGLVMFPHGAQKLLGWYGGFGAITAAGLFFTPIRRHRHRVPLHCRQGYEDRGFDSP